MWWVMFGRWKGVGNAAVCAMLLSACAQDPDFGRYSPSPLQRVRAALAGEQPVTGLALTADEAELRAMAANLTAPNPAFAKKGFWSAQPPAALSASPAYLEYYERLRARHPSPDALANELTDDIGADTGLMEHFAVICEQVVAADAERVGALSGHPSSRTDIGVENPASFIDVRTRVFENGRIIEAAATTMSQRLVSYRAALDHARLDAPVGESLDAVADAIRQMDDQLAQIDRSAARHEAMEKALTGGVAG